MSGVKQLSSLYAKIPGTVRSFLLRAVGIFIGWQLLYQFVLVPARIPDIQLTNLTAVATAKSLSLFWNNVSFEYVTAVTQRTAVIFLDGKRLVGIADPCNGLDLFILYIGFLFCFPSSAKRRLIFLLAGIPAIFVANIIRCVIMSWLNIYHRDWVDISHHYIFTTVMYLFIFYVWMLYAKKPSYAVQS
jgi:exosortase/archaeosortase family protein